VNIRNPIVITDDPIVNIGHPIVITDDPIVNIGHPIVITDHPIVIADHPIVITDHPIMNILDPTVNTDDPIMNIRHLWRTNYYGVSVTWVIFGASRSRGTFAYFGSAKKSNGLPLAESSAVVGPRRTSIGPVSRRSRTCSS